MDNGDNGQGQWDEGMGPRTALLQALRTTSTSTSMYLMAPVDEEADAERDGRGKVR